MNLTEPSAPPRTGILEAVLRSTLLKDLIRLKMSAVHPDSGRKAVRTLLGQDPEVFFGIAGGLPAAVNGMLGGLTELAVQLKGKYPPELLKTFLASLLEDVDRDAARECGRAWAGLAASVLQSSPELRALAVRTFLARVPAISAGAINAFARFVNGLTREDPQALGRFVSEVFESVDGKELSAASAVVANALLDQKWHLVSWTWRLAKERVGRWLKAFGSKS